MGPTDYITNAHAKYGYRLGEGVPDAPLAVSRAAGDGRFYGKWSAKDARGSVMAVFSNKTDAERFVEVTNATLVRKAKP